MKYTCTVDINLPIEEVVNLWADESKLKEWQDSFLSIEHLEGKPGTVGAKSKLIYQEGKRKMELIEIILVNNLPKKHQGLYEHKDMTNIQTTRFEQISVNQTRYISEVDYTGFHAFLPKMMAKIFPRVFRKQSQKWMDQFKTFAERS